MFCTVPHPRTRTKRGSRPGRRRENSPEPCQASPLWEFKCCPVLAAEAAGLSAAWRQESRPALHKGDAGSLALTALGALQESQQLSQRQRTPATLWVCQVRQREEASHEMRKMSVVAAEDVSVCLLCDSALC